MSIGSARRSPALLATVTALPVALLAGLLTFWVLRDNGTDEGPVPGSATGTVTVSPPPADQATEVACRALLAKLPGRLLGPARPVRATPPQAKPIAERAAAWGDPAITLRCGVARPAALTPTAQLFGVNGVEWVAAEAKNSVVWTTASLGVFVEVTVPKVYKDKASTEILLPLADPITQTIKPT